MGIFTRLQEIRPAAMNSDELYRLIIGTFGYGPTNSGLSVTTDSAMRMITVQNCVRLRFFTISQLPCHIMETVGRLKNRAEDFYLYELLHDQPNSWMTAPEFWGMAEAHVSTRGNFYAFKSQLPGRPIRELIPLGPDMVQEVRQNDDYSLEYVVQFANGDIRTIPGEKIMHLRGLVMNGYMGLNPIQYVREAIGIGLAGEKFLARYFGNGMHPGAVIKHPMNLNAPAHANLRANLKTKYEGLGQSHEFMLLDEAMEITFPELKLVDQQFIEQMKMTEAQICGLFRVPLMLVQAGDKAPTYASSEQFMLAYTRYGVTPDCVNYEKAIRRDLLTPQERKRYYAKFNLDALLRSDLKSRMEAYQVGINSEIINPNEARELEDMNPYEGGDIYRTRTSTVKQTDKQSDKEVKK